MKPVRLIAAGIAALLFLLVAGGWALWRNMAPTRIALVNFSGYKTAPMFDTVPEWFFRVETVEWNDAIGRTLRNFDLILFQGMGMSVSETQKAAIEELQSRGIPLYVHQDSRPDCRFGTLPREQRETVAGYFANGSRENYRRLWHYLRYEIDGKRLFAPKPEPPRILPADALFHTAPEALFQSKEAYFNYYRKAGKFHPGAPTVALVIPGDGGAARGEPGYLTDIIQALEARKLNVVGISGNAKRLDFLKEISPDLVIYLPHGRLTDEKAEEAVAFLRKRNIPLLCPIKVYRTLEQYDADPRGLSGGMLSQSVTVPELDGGAVPFLLTALRRDERGIEEQWAIPERLEKFALLVENYLNLKRKKNFDKRIAIFFYKEPGQNALHASGLEVAESLLSLLRRLKQEGYDTGPLPENPAQLIAAIQREAAVFGAYAEGEIHRFAAREETEFLPLELFEELRKKAFPASLIADQERLYGPPPGRYMATVRDGKSGLVVGRLTFGKVTLLPQPLSGIGGDASKIVHGTKEAPPYPYAAAYLWSRFVFRADAMLHFGTHGSLEFTPARMIGLLDDDWPDALTGPVPHYYLYVINNIGEALAAKRRSYATLIGHLTAPFMNAGLSGELASLDGKLHAIESADNPMLAAEYRRSAGELAEKLGIVKDLKLPLPLTDDGLERLHNHLHEISESKVARGMYVLGRPYSRQELDETALLMTVDDLAARNFEADLAAGKVAEEKRENQRFYDEHYLAPARARISAALAKGDAGRREAPDTFAARDALALSTRAELDALVNALRGGFIAPGPGGSPVLNPDTVPTGRNLYGIDPERTPTRESFAVGRRLGEALIESRLRATGKYPRKVAFSLWGGEFIRTQGTTLGEILFLLGVEPVWDSRGRVRSVRLIPAEKLGRPRIDVAVQTSGQFRGIAASRMILIDRAVRMAARAAEIESAPNFVQANSRDAEKRMIAEGLSPERAKELADARIFGRINNGFGTGVREQVEDSGRWNERAELADHYFENMGTIYTENHWNEHVPAAFRAALANTDAIIHSRSSSSSGPLSLDDIYQFMGGLSLAVKTVNGQEADAFFNDLRNSGRAKIQELGEAAMVEARSTLLNPNYLREMMAEGQTAANNFAKTVRNSFAWEALRPEMLSDHLWEEYKQTFVDDRYRLGMRDYFKKKNPYALEEITAVMLETARKGFWKADPATVKQLAELHAELVRDHGPGCSGFVCDNAPLRKFIGGKLVSPEAKQSYEKSISSIRTAAASPQVTGMTLKEEKRELKEEERTGRTAVTALLAVVAVAAAALWLGHRRNRRFEE